MSVSVRKQKNNVDMSIEILLVLIGLLIFGTCAWQRFVGRASQEDHQHLSVLANLGCVFVIIGIGALILETLSGIN